MLRGRARPSATPESRSGGSPEAGERVSHADVGGKNVPGREHTCEDPGGRPSWARGRKEVRGGAVGWVERKERAPERRGVHT